MNIKHKEIKTLYNKLFSNEEQKDIEEIYKKVLSDDDFENWRHLLDAFDEKIGGIGSKQLMVKCTDASGWTGHYPSGRENKYRNIYRSLQYVLGYYFVGKQETTRLGIFYCCIHIEEIMKKKFKNSRSPLGKIVNKIKNRNILDSTMMELLENVVPIWNEVKHELDDEPLTFQIKNKKVISSSEHRFSTFEVVVMYFISRKIGAMLTEEMML
jgi:hypothetical protein